MSVKRSSKERAGDEGVFSMSEEETFEIGRTLGRGLGQGDLVVLEGPLGIGKTVFARGLAAGLGVAPEEVCSPSYTIIQEYEGDKRAVYHVDLYRLEQVDEIAALGLEELLESGGVVVVEWGERLPASYRRDAITVRFHDLGQATRRIQLLNADGPQLEPGDH